MTAIQPALPAALLQLADERPDNLRSFHLWCRSCYKSLEEHEIDDAKAIDPNELHEHAALLIRQALVYVRRFVDPAKADQMPRDGAKCVSHALIRFQECIDWCEAVEDAQPAESTLIEVDCWSSLLVAVDLPREKFYASVDQGPTTTVDLGRASRLLVAQAQLQGLFRAFAEHSDDGFVVGRERAYSAMPFNGKRPWRENKKDASRKLLQAINTLSLRFRKQYVYATKDSSAPFSCKRGTNLVESAFRIVGIRMTESATAEII